MTSLLFWRAETAGASGRCIVSPAFRAPHTPSGWMWAKSS